MKENCKINIEQNFRMFVLYSVSLIGCLKNTFPHFIVILKAQLLPVDKKQSIKNFKEKANFLDRNKLLNLRLSQKESLNKRKHRLFPVPLPPFSNLSFFCEKKRSMLGKWISQLN